MRERIPLLVPLVCLVGWGLSGFGVGMWLAALCGSVVTLLLAAPALFRNGFLDGGPVSLPSLQAPPFSVERVVWSAALSLCVTAGALSIGSLAALTVGGGRIEVWTMTLLLGMLSVLAFAPVAIFLRPDDRSRPRPAAGRAALAKTPQKTDADAPSPKRPQRQRQPADFIPQPIFDANRHLSRSRRTIEEKERRIEEFRSLWSYAGNRSEDTSAASESGSGTSGRTAGTTEVFTPNGPYSASAADTFLNGTQRSSTHRSGPENPEAPRSEEFISWELGEGASSSEPADAERTAES